jgi:oligopeptide/dipeptide ABC transporter ATP-binding protein
MQVAIMKEGQKLLDVKNLKTYFYTPEGTCRAVDGITFHVNKGESLGIVGESGCGKSVTSLSVMRLVPSPPGKIVSGEIFFNQSDLLKKPESKMRRIRGRKISMIFQEPMTCLNPVYSVGDQIAEVYQIHENISRKQALTMAVEMVRLVGIPMPERRIKEYPHQMSGGMRQRVMIAMALACKPGLLIADEPTTALDVTIQAQILSLMKDLKERMGMAIIIITHDLGVIAEMAERVIVVYAGQIMEEAISSVLFAEPLHPYTVSLLKSVPTVEGKQDKLFVIPGNVPDPLSFPSGCRFHNRCYAAFERCKTEEPPLVTVGSDRKVRCWLHMVNGGDLA